MNLIVHKIMRYMESEEWQEIDMMKMELGFQVLIHDFLMIGFILGLAKYLGMFTDSLVLFLGFGLLKLTAGGIHFKTSLLCLLSTSTFIITGVVIANHINLSLYGILCIFLICMMILWIVAPQGTKNNPICEEDYIKRKKETIIISGIYLWISIYTFILGRNVPYLLLVAVVFETVSLLPNTLSRYKQYAG